MRSFRTEAFGRLQRLWRLAEYSNTHQVTGREAIAREAGARAAAVSRRRFLGLAATAAAAAPFTGGAGRVLAASPRIAIIGAGLAGLACADRLRARGVTPVVYEAGARVGGRCYSNRTLVPGMALENGGELIDTGHKMMINYAREFGLGLESYIRNRGEEQYWFFGRHWSDADVVDEFRAVVANMQPDLHAISGSASFYDANAADFQFDQMDLATYFATRTTGRPLIEAVLNEAYRAEYGLETWQQSTLNFLGFMRLNRQSKFEPFGVSDERYHLIDGNDGIVHGLAARIGSNLVTGARLTRLTRTASGRFALFFNGSRRGETADAVVLAIPFTVLRQVDLDPSLGLSADKQRAIANLGYGTNAKTMIAFEGRPWAELHAASGGIYSDLPQVQATWETNRARADRYGVLTDYASGDRGAALRPGRVQQQVDAFLTDADRVLPGLRARAALNRGRYVAHLEHWPTNPLSLGSYTCYQPGQFTTVAGLEGEAAGLVKFAGEHADSFYSWQGYMEGACLSGHRAANELLDDLKSGALA